ncbi:VOC family protein [Peribacillus deserti]|uniref:Ornithine monooxygenase n=1 Tax=Peribacillus deserti TaxID=673318 RepID=A0A2N5M3I2_9BACI|nr:ornithine monooxygenase [Peribacillus deserti]PLT28917.1 ornithine monooxygenase [Peribacillus deserti]
MIYEMTIQVRVADFNRGYKWYETLLKRNADLIPHEGFAEWELVPGCWLQVAGGIPSDGSGPVRLGVTDIESERNRIMSALGVSFFDIHTREEVPVKWAGFTDPWGNRLGFFEYKNINDKEVQIQRMFGSRDAQK